MAGPRQPRTKKAAPRAADDLRRADREQAEDALRESEEMQRILLEGSPDPIFSFTPEGRYRYVNQAFAEGVGKTVEGIIGKTIWDILSQEEADKRFAALSQVLRTGEEVVIEGRVPRADGDRYFVTTISPLKDPEGRVTSAICSAKDITAREHAEEALRQSEERHKEMIAGISDVIAIMAVDGTLRYKSPNIERHFGWLPEDLVGTNGWETVHPDDLERIQREFLALLDEHDSVVTVEYRYKCKDGGYKMIELTATNLTNSPLIDGVLMNYHDITARRQAEQSVRESEQRLLRAQGMAHVGNWELDLRTRTMWASEEAFRVYGIEHTAPTLPLDLVKAGALPEYRPGLDEALERLIAGQAKYDEEFELRRANDGRVRVVHSIAELVRADDGAPASVVGAVQDVTELKAAEREALDAAAQLRRTVEGAVLAISLVVETRDPYTAGHERRVSELAAAIALEMGMAGEALDALRLGGLIHDIGKIAVPAEILAKPGLLSDVEFNLIKQHPQAGYDILAAIDFGLPVAEMVLQHHERLDGSGYPRGLAGEDVLPEARILAVADVVEAMSSHRPYRPGLGMAAALAEVRAHAGVKYDADVVATCVRLVEEQGFAFTV